MTSFESLHPRISNGTFTDKTQSAPELTLDAQIPSAGIIEVPVAGRWTERNVIPTPRHRTPRDVQRDIDVTVTIPAITSDEAPVAVILPNDPFELRGDAIELRTYEGQLYKALTVDGRGAVPATGDAVSERIFDRWGHGQRTHLKGDNAWQAEQDAQSQVSALLAIDDTIWEKTSEPVYVISTFGFNNGTSVGIEWASRYAEEGHTMPEWVYPADQREEAIAAAIASSANRDRYPFTGGNVPTIALNGKFQPGSTFTPAPRITYAGPYEAENAERYEGDEGRIARELLAFRQQLLTIPGAVIEVDDGWGGTTKTVDPSKLTSTQASDYKRYTELEENLRLGSR